VRVAAVSPPSPSIGYLLLSLKPLMAKL